ncbi:MAG: hypothetical protein JWL97_1288 [Gemmatimonadales bacterium]|jgi:hypothetical protein|nr:hypothetical protein [Gemmatimonadales bacterium]
MSSAGIDAILLQDPLSPPTAAFKDASRQSVTGQREMYVPTTAASDTARAPRRTPRKSLIVVLPENHVVSPDLVTNSLPGEGIDEVVDVILACAGPPLGITALQRRVRDLQILLAPAGTSTEDLRELAMSQAPGDIVTLLSGIPARA